MIPDSWRAWLGEPGTLALFAVIAGAIVRLLRSNKLNEFLEQRRWPTVPGYALPFLALFFGALFEYLDKRSQGQTATVRDFVMAIITGLASGSLAIAGNETIAKTGARVQEHREVKAALKEARAKEDSMKPPPLDEKQTPVPVASEEKLPDAKD